MSALAQLDKKVFEAASIDLPIMEMLQYQAEIAALRYTIGHELAVSEMKMLRAKEKSEMHELKTRLVLQSSDKKLSSTKAADLVRDRDDTELLRLGAIEAKGEHTRLKQALDTSDSMLVSLAQRIKRQENDEMTSKYQQMR